MRVMSARECGQGLSGKFALVLLCLVVLELVLIGQQVQPVKGLKKKIYLKKLRKILPFLALVKPKKKLILVPIPIPMYDKQPLSYAPNYQGQAHHMHTMHGEGSSPPMSFIMMTEPNMMIDSSARPPPLHIGGGGGFGAAPRPESAAMMMPSMTMTIQADGSGTMSAIELNPSSRRPAATPSLASASVSSALPPSNNTVSGALLAGQPSNWPEQQQLQQYDYDLDEQFMSDGNLINESALPQQAAAGGEHYYSSPWQSSRPPPQLASPAKHLRKERLRQQQQRPAAAQTAQAKTRTQRNQQTITVNQMSGRPTNQAKQQQQQQRTGKQQQPQRFSAPMPVLIVKNQWRPSAPAVHQQRQASDKSVRQNERVQQERHLEEPRGTPKLTREQEQQISRALEQESLVQVGPARMLPVYQSPSGRLSMTPPVPSPGGDISTHSPSTSTSTVGSGAPGEGANNSFDHEISAALAQPNSNAEVQTISSPPGSSFFQPPAIGDTPTATEYSIPVRHSPSSPAEPVDLPYDGQHTASEPTTTSSSRGSSESASAQATTNSTVEFTTGSRLIMPAVKGGRIQSAQPPQPPVEGTKDSQVGSF